MDGRGGGQGLRETGLRAFPVGYVAPMNSNLSASPGGRRPARADEHAPDDDMRQADRANGEPGATDDGDDGAPGREREPQ